MKQRGRRFEHCAQNPRDAFKVDPVVDRYFEAEETARLQREARRAARKRVTLPTLKFMESK